MAFYTDENVRIDFKNYHDWVLPRKVLLSIFITGVILEILGAVLLAVGGSHPSRASAFNASGAVMLGLGACLHAILLLLCCHAYCVIYTRDEDTQTQEIEDREATGNNLKENDPDVLFNLPIKKSYTLIDGYQSTAEQSCLNVFQCSHLSSTSRHNPQPKEIYSCQFPVTCSIVTPLSTSSPIVTNTHKSLAANQSQQENAEVYDYTKGLYSKLYSRSKTGSGDARLVYPIHAITDKPPSAMKKSNADRTAERKRVRLSPVVQRRYETISTPTKSIETNAETELYDMYQSPAVSFEKEKFSNIRGLQSFSDMQESYKQTDINKTSDTKNYNAWSNYCNLSYFQQSEPENRKYAITAGPVSHVHSFFNEVNHCIPFPRVPEESLVYSNNLSDISPVQYKDDSHVTLREQREPTTNDSYSIAKMSVYDNLGTISYQTTS